MDKFKKEVFERIADNNRNKKLQNVGFEFLRNTIAYKYSYNDKQIELKVFRNDNSVCFSVKDNGIGMTRRLTKRVFDRFYQADSTLARQAEGTGLGLSIVKFIIDAHKGKIDIESNPNKGSIFTMKLTAVTEIKLNGNSINNRR